MTPTTNLEPAILAVGCELELAPNPLFFAPRYNTSKYIFYKDFRVFSLRAKRKFIRVLGRVQILILAKNLDPSFPPLRVKKWTSPLAVLQHLRPIHQDVPQNL